MPPVLPGADARLTTPPYTVERVAKSKNACRRCFRTWTPRGSALSAVCPTCKSEDVTFESVFRREREQATGAAAAAAAGPHALPPQSTPQPLPMMAPAAPPQPRPSGARGCLIAIAVVFALALIGTVLFFGAAVVAAMVSPPQPKSSAPRAAPVEMNR